MKFLFFFTVSFFASNYATATLVPNLILDCEVETKIEGMDLYGQYSIYSLEGAMFSKFKMISLKESPADEMTSTNVIMEKYNVDETSQAVFGAFLKLAKVKIQDVNSVIVYTIEPNDDGSAATIVSFIDKNMNVLGKSGTFGWIPGKCK